MRCGVYCPYAAAAPATVSGIRDPNATGLALQAREGGPRDHREPGDRPLTNIELVRRWVDGRGVMGLLEYAAGSAVVAALACCHSAAYAQSNSDQLPPVVVNPDAPPKPVTSNSQRSGSSGSGPSAAGHGAGRSRPCAAAARRGGGNGGQRARADQPHWQLDWRHQRRDTRYQQPRFAGRRPAHRSRCRCQRKRRAGFDDERTDARRQYRPDTGDDRRHPGQRPDRGERRFRFRDVRAERDRTHRSSERPAKRAVRVGRDGWRRQHHHQEGFGTGAIQRPHRRRKLRHRGDQRIDDGIVGSMVVCGHRRRAAQQRLLPLRLSHPCPRGQIWSAGKRRLRSRRRLGPRRLRCRRRRAARSRHALLVHAIRL